MAGGGSADDMFADSDDEAGAPGPRTRPNPPDPSSAAQRPAPSAAGSVPAGGAGPSHGGAGSGAEPDAPAARGAAGLAVAQVGGSSASVAEARNGTAGANGIPSAAVAPAGNGHAAAAAPAQDADDYASWPVKELRRFLQERGMDLGGIVDKSELVAKVRVRTWSRLHTLWGLMLD